mmetsp:Transcript_34739/g.74059  ORF Transcript_34739/g.74059 Transcript_34739/m.74059 type:complete len:214 (+) Transcript_34739:51-692(+)
MDVRSQAAMSSRKQQQCCSASLRLICLRLACLRLRSLILVQAVRLAVEWQEAAKGCCRRAFSSGPLASARHHRVRARRRQKTSRTCLEGEGTQVAVQMPGHCEPGKHQHGGDEGDTAGQELNREGRRHVLPHRMPGCGELETHEHLHGTVAKGKHDVARQVAVALGRRRLPPQGGDSETDEAAQGIVEGEVDRGRRSLGGACSNKGLLKVAHP